MNENKQETRSLKKFFGCEFFYFVILFAAIFAIFGRSLSFQFVYDDHDFIEKNPNIQSINFVPEYFKKSLWALSAAPETPGDVFHPIQLLSYLIDGKVFGIHAWGFHLASVLWHFCVVALLFILLQKFLFSATSAFWICLLFGLHPTVSEPVYFISARIDPLAATFFLLTCLFLSSYRKLNMVWGTISYLACLLSKEIGMILFPALIWISKGRKWVGGVILIPLLIYQILRHQIQSQVPFGVFLQTPLHIEWWLFLVRYLELVVFPFSPLGYRQHLGEPVSLMAWVSVFLVCGLIGVNVWFKKGRHPVSILGLFVFLPTLCLAASLTLISGIICDRYMYFSILGFFMMISPWVEIFLLNRFSRTVLFGLALLFSSFSFLAGNQWKDEMHLWSFAAEMNPGSPNAHRNLGVVYFEKGEKKLARTEFIKAYEASSPEGRHRQVHLNSLHSLAALEYSEGNKEKAKELFKKLLGLDPANSRYKEILKSVK